MGCGLRASAAAWAAQRRLAGQGVDQGTPFDRSAAKAGKELGGPFVAFGSAADRLQMHHKTERGAAVSLRQRFGDAHGVEQGATPATQPAGNGQGRQAGCPNVRKVGMWEGARAVLFAGALGEGGGEFGGDGQPAVQLCGRWRVHRLDFRFLSQSGLNLSRRPYSSIAQGSGAGKIVCSSGESCGCILSS